MIAHILSSSVVPAAAQWAAMGVAALGGLGVLRRRSALLDLAGWATFVAGSAACVTMIGVGMLAPVAPTYTLSVALNNPPTSPLQVTVCARTASGAEATTPGAGDVLAVLVDGTQVGTETTNTFAVVMTPGPHRLRVELLTGDHREFNPPVAVDTGVVAAGPGGIQPWATCPEG